MSDPGTSAPAVVEMGWSRRASGASLFVNGTVHLMLVGQERHEARTLCGREIPRGALAEDVSVARTSMIGVTVDPMDEHDLAGAKRCTPCARRLAEADEETRR